MLWIETKILIPDPSPIPGENGGKIADDIYKFIFVNKD